jgi:hypothetical protein
MEAKKNEEPYTRGIQMTSSAVPRPVVVYPITALCEFYDVLPIRRFIVNNTFDLEPTLEEMDRVITHFENIELMHIAEFDVTTDIAESMVCSLLWKKVQLTREMVARVVVDEDSSAFDDWENLFLDEKGEFSSRKVFALYRRLYPDDAEYKRMKAAMFTAMTDASFEKIIIKRQKGNMPQVPDVDSASVEQYPDVVEARMRVVSLAREMQIARTCVPIDRAQCNYSRMIEARRMYNAIINSIIQL